MSIIYKTFIHFITLYKNRKVDRIHRYSKHDQIFFFCNKNLFYFILLIKRKTYSETLNIMNRIYLLGLNIKKLPVVQRSFTLKTFHSFLGFIASFTAFVRLSPLRCGQTHWSPSTQLLGTTSTSFVSKKETIWNMPIEQKKKKNMSLKTENIIRLLKRVHLSSTEVHHT